MKKILVAVILLAIIIFFRPHGRVDMDSASDAPKVGASANVHAFSPLEQVSTGDGHVHITNAIFRANLALVTEKATDKK